MLVWSSTLEKGIDVRKELNICEIAYEQYDVCFNTNFYAEKANLEKPFSQEYVKKALRAYTVSKVLLKEFVEYVVKIDELKEDYNKYNGFVQEYGLTKGYFVEQAQLLKPFIQSLEEQSYLIPIVEATLAARR